MLSRISFLLIIAIVVVGVLQHLGINTGVSFVDHRIEALNSSLVSYFETPEVSPTTQEIDTGEPAWFTFVGDYLEPLLGRWKSESVAAANFEPESAEDALTVQTEGWVVQIAAFSDPANADRLVNGLRDQQLEPWTLILDEGLHAVRLGPFQGRSTAETVVHSVEESTGLSPLLIPAR